MKASAAQTERIRRSGHRKETMIEPRKEESEEEVQILILKKIRGNIARG